MKVNLRGFFVESIKRLYRNRKINESKVIELFNSGKITEEEKDIILNI